MLRNKSSSSYLSPKATKFSKCGTQPFFEAGELLFAPDGLGVATATPHPANRETEHIEIFIVFVIVVLDNNYRENYMMQRKYSRHDEKFPNLYTCPPPPHLAFIQEPSGLVLEISGASFNISCKSQTSCQALKRLTVRDQHLSKSPYIGVTPRIPRDAD